MDRVQARRIRDQQAQLAQEQAQRDADKFNILRPALQAKATADVAAANNAVAGLQTTEQMRAQAHEEMPGFRDEWAQASQIDDPSERVRAMSGVLGKAAKYESVGELKPEIDMWKNVFAGQAITERTLAAVDARNQASADAATEKASHDREMADLKAKHAKELQDIKNAAPKGTYTYLVQAMQDARDAGDEETANLLDAQIKKRNHIAQPYSDAERIKTLDDEANAAEADGNPALAKSMRDRIKYLTKRGGSGDREAKLQAILGVGGGAAPAAPVSPKPGKTAPAAVVPPQIKF
jgi:hypothetical protein